MLLINTGMHVYILPMPVTLGIGAYSRSLCESAYCNVSLLEKYKTSH